MEFFFGIIIERDDNLLCECLVSLNDNLEYNANSQQQDWVYYPGYITKLVLRNFSEHFPLIKIEVNSLMVSVLDVFLLLERRTREHIAKTLESVNLDRKIISYQE